MVSESSPEKVADIYILNTVDEPADFGTGTRMLRDDRSVLTS
jgi:hypothetical protein